MRRLRLNASAKRDLREIATYLRFEGVDRRSITGILSALGAQCQKLADLPGDLGRPRPDLAEGVRSFPFRGYAIFFRYSEDEIEIVHVLSTRQNVRAHLTGED